jgi:hypothetical protein
VKETQDPVCNRTKKEMTCCLNLNGDFVVWNLKFRVVEKRR